MTARTGALVAAILLVLLGIAPATGQDGAPVSAGLDASIRKANAYVALMNRTLRASESWSRYASWVDVRKGPTGKERIVYGLYGLYDVRDEIANALKASTEPPAWPEADETLKRYVAAYEALAPLIGEAEGYYERKDYLADKMAGGKALHVKLKPAAEAFLAERATFERDMAMVQSDLNRAELEALERSEGRKARWQVRNVMIEARGIVDLLPTNAAPVVRLAAFDAALDRYAAAVKELDDYARANPGSFHVFESQPRSLLGKLREMRAKLGRTKGDARKAGVGFELTWIINDYNMMVSTAESATAFAK
ncbi:MAG: YiiG family protein [Pseudomonadota bacterium]